MIVTAALPIRDWAHVLNAIHSSHVRKLGRGDKRGADEMALIWATLARQFQQAKENVKPDGGKF